MSAPPLPYITIMFVHDLFGACLGCEVLNVFFVELDNGCLKHFVVLDHYSLMFCSTYIWPNALGSLVELIKITLNNMVSLGHLRHDRLFEWLNRFIE